MRHGLLSNLDMRANCKTIEVLEALRNNRSRHAKIVEEAKAGYLDKAQAELNKRFAQLRSGKVVGLQFGLSVPVDYTKEYDTVIRMLDMHQDEFIELSPDEVRMFIEDRWDWSDQFISSNSAYSGTARMLSGDDE